MKISSKIVLTFAPLAVVSLATLGWLGYDTAKKALTQQAMASLQSLADLQQRRIEGIVQQNAERLVLVSSRTHLRLSLKQYLLDPEPAHIDNINRILRDARANIQDFRKLFVQTSDGRVVASTSAALIGSVHPRSDEFAVAMSGRRVNVFYLRDTGELGVYLAAPLLLDDELLGVLVIDADASQIVASTTSYGGLGETGEALLLRRGDDGGAIFLTPARFDAGAALTRAIPPDATQSPYVTVLEPQRPDLMRDAIGYQGHQVLAALRQIAGTGWGLVVQKRMSEAFAPIDRLRAWTLTLSTLFSAIVVAVSLFLARSITRPVMQLTEVASRISAGVLSERAVISTRDEVNVLANAFNHMTERLLNDIDERRKAEEKFHALLTSAPDGILITTAEGEIIIANRRAEEMFGLQGAAMIGTPIGNLLVERSRDTYREMLQRFVATSISRAAPGSLELSILDARGTEVPVEISLAPIETGDGLLFANALRDITDRKLAEAKLVQQANFDNLTGLPSRLLANDRLSQALARAHRNSKVIAVMFLDIDRFKNVNDTLGHSVGDTLLTEVASRILGCVRESDTVARLGGDEFLVVLPDLDNLAASEIVADQILSALSEPFDLDNRQLFVSASIGITGFPMDSRDRDVLLRNADAAMYRAKEEGRNTYRFYTAEMNEQLRSRVEMEEQLRYAIARGELYLDFQPQLDLQHDRLLGAEALLRWHNVRLGQIPPDRFIPLAEETGLIHVIGEWVLQQACAQAAAWQTLSESAIRVAVNVSALQFKRGDLRDVVARVLQQTGLPAALLELELTERVLVEDSANAKRALAELKEMGVRLSLDDFGTGYSSLGYLKWFPCDVLKIDRTFISGITENKDDAALCRAILAMGGSLNMTVIAEGVETAEQLAFLAAHGVDAVQGYYVSRPMAAAAFAEMLADPHAILIRGDRK